MLCVDAKRFYQIENEGLLVVVIRVQEPNIRVKAGKDAGLFYQRIEDAITVVETGVKGVFCRPPGSALELIFFRKQDRH